MKHNITHLFNKFAGMELRNPDRLTTDIDPVAAEMAQLAKDNGFKLRIKFPGKMFTQDFRTDRVNAHVVKGAKGKFIIQKFSIG